MTNQKPQISYMAAKALGFVNSISNLSREERARNPSGIFGKDYNGLRDAVRTHCPELDSYLPPRVILGDNGDYVIGNYGEIYTFCEQLYQMLINLDEK